MVGTGGATPGLAIVAAGPDALESDLRNAGFTVGERSAPRVWNGNALIIDSWRELATRLDD